MASYCAFCGTRLIKHVNRSKEHVFPRGLYPESKRIDDLQLLTVPACSNCNNSWSSDEEHFRTVLSLAGDPPNETRKELWEKRVNRSLDKSYGQQDLQELLDMMRPVETAQGRRYMIYPGEDARVLRVVRKIIRGLCYHHGLMSPVLDKQVDVHIVTQEDAENITPGVLAPFSFGHREPDVVQYMWHSLPQGHEMNSAWFIQFYEQVTFFGLVYAN